MNLKKNLCPTSLIRRKNPGIKKRNDWKFLFIWNAADGRKMLWDQAKAEAFSRENVLRVLEEECI